MGVAAISYDSVEILDHFAKRLGITIPLLSDEGSEIIRAFGLFNPNIPTDNYRYGVPFPGTYVVDEKGIVRAKYFEKILRERITAETVLTKQFGVAGGRRARAENRHLTVTAYSSQDVIRRGNRIALVLDIEVAEKTHLYAPGAKGYTPVSFVIDENPHLEVHEAEFPEPHILDMPEIKEKIPIFEGAVRISQDVTVSHEFYETGDFEITGSFVYQACFETFCYEPATIPLSFDLELVAHDDERVPEALRKK